MNALVHLVPDQLIDTVVDLGQRQATLLGVYRDLFAVEPHVGQHAIGWGVRLHRGRGIDHFNVGKLNVFPQQEPNPFDKVVTRVTF